MKRVWQWIELCFALGAIGIVVAFLIYAFKLHSDGAAAWVQAVGSIAAILVAVWIASRQAEADQRLRRAELVDRLGAVQVMLATCQDRLVAFRQEVLMAPMINGIKFANVRTLSAVRVALNAVTAIAPVQAPTPSAASALIAAQTAIANSVGVIPSAQTEGQFHDAWTGDLNMLCDAITDAAAMLTAEMTRIQGS